MLFLSASYRLNDRRTYALQVSLFELLYINDIIIVCSSMLGHGTVILVHDAWS